MNWLLIALWGGAVGLDGTSALQLMISRPMVAATVTGALLGRPAEALVLGIILELFSLVILPIGAARYPESGISAVIAAVVYVDGVSAGSTAGAGFAPAALILAVVYGLVWEWVAGGSVNLLRRVNEWIIADAPSRGVVGAGRLERLHLGAIALDWLRAVTLVIVGSALGLRLVGGLERYWWPDDGMTTGILAVAAATILGATLSLFGGWSIRRLPFLFGIICGLMLLLFR
jgi:PTS system mannose-specific IIC component